jgi:CBS domain containing-hemolysin-like protein
MTTPLPDAGGIAWRLAVTLLFVLINGFFVAAEFALVKVRSARIDALAAEGRSAAVSVRGILARLDLYLSACQLGITLASLVLGWLAEPAVATMLLAGAHGLGLPIDDSPWVHGVALALALTIVTILHMTIGEQAPKIWAIQRPEETALRTSRPLRLFTLVFRPLIALVNAISNALLRVAGAQPHGELDGVYDVEELRTVIAASATAGHLTKRQRGLVQNVLGLVEQEVRHILVPRVDVVSLDVDAHEDEQRALLRESRHSRLPLVRGDLDDCLGIVHVRDVLAALLGGQTPDLAQMARPAVVVPDAQPLGRFIGGAQASGDHAAIVVDEHGTAIGMVFLEDAIETIVGPIRDELDPPVEPDVVEAGPGALEIAGHVALPVASGALDVSLRGEEDTIGGHVVATLGRLPREGDVVELAGYRVTVLRVARRRVERLRFERTPKDA